MQITQRAVAVLTALLEEHTGQELKEARQWRVGSALSGVLRDNNCSDLNELAGIIQKDYQSELSRRVVEALLNNETYFFRDLPVFRVLEERILPAMMTERQAEKKLSIWCAGCSTGQEALSLAMILAEKGQVWDDWQIEILATDVSQSAIHSARKGCYNQFEIQRGIDIARMLRWFTESDEGWLASEKLLSRIKYVTHNVLDSPPTTRRFDLILCRNVLFYFDSATRTKAYTRLASAIADNGYLLLGGGETPRGHSGLFAQGSTNSGFYRPSSFLANQADVIRKAS